VGVYEESWDKPHAPSQHPSWQESDWLTFFDPVAEVGGIYRIGREPNRRVGQPNLFIFALHGQRFLMRDLGGRGADVAMGVSDEWENGYCVGGHRVEALGGGRIQFRWDYPDTSGSLQFHDSHYMPRDWSLSGKGASIIATLNADGHLECAGQLTGEIRIGAESYRIDCFSHRDRSWGERDHYMRRMKRAFGTWGTVGPEFSFAIMRLELAAGETLVTGFVHRRGHGDDIADARFITTLDGDFLSPIRGQVLLSLENGESLSIDCGIAQAHGGFAPGTSFNSVGRLVWEGKSGFCDYSATGNPGGGDHVAADGEARLLALGPGLSLSRSTR